MITMPPYLRSPPTPLHLLTPLTKRLTPSTTSGLERDKASEANDVCYDRRTTGSACLPSEAIFLTALTLHTLLN